MPSLSGDACAMSAVIEDQCMACNSSEALIGGRDLRVSYGKLIELLKSNNRNSIIAHDDLAPSKTTAIPRSLFKFLLHLQSNGKGIQGKVFETPCDSDCDNRSKAQSHISHPSVRELNPLIQTVGFISDMFPSIHKNEAEISVRVISGYDVSDGVAVNLVMPECIKHASNRGEAPLRPAPARPVGRGDGVNISRRSSSISSARYNRYSGIYRSGGSCRLYLATEKTLTPMSDLQEDDATEKSAEDGVFGDRGSLSLPMLMTRASVGEKENHSSVRVTRGPDNKPKLNGSGDKDVGTFKNNKMVRKVREMITLNALQGNQTHASGRQIDLGMLDLRTSSTVTSGIAYKHTFKPRKLSMAIFRATSNKGNGIKAGVLKE